MRILRLRLLSTGEYRIVVHVDETKLREDALPDPRYVYRLEWPQKPAEMTHAEYLQQERPRIRQLCLRVLAHIEATEGAALPGEGDPL
jgi:hypothetical protein